MKIRFGIATEQNRQPEPPDRKPNEDRVTSLQKEDVVAIAVMDGIPVLRDANGFYPRENGVMASQVAADEIGRFLIQQGAPNADAMNRAFSWANAKIRDLNENLGMYKKLPPQWIATVGCSLWASEKSGDVFFGYIDDPLGFVIAPDQNITLITEDQHVPSEGHFWAEHEAEMLAQDPAGNAKFRAHQDTHIRNHVSAKCWCGELFRGWGALTGEEAAMNFVSIISIRVSLGTRIVLSTDAFEAIGQGNAKERRVEDYRNVLLATRAMEPQMAAQELVRLIRINEEEKRYKSDDAGLAIIDFVS